MKVLWWIAWCIIFGGDTFIFTFLYSMWCVSMSVIVLAWDGNPRRTGAVGPFLVMCLVLSLCFLYTCFVLPAREGSAALYVVRMLLLLAIVSEN